jgi:hypothetical protein
VIIYACAGDARLRPGLQPNGLHTARPIVSTAAAQRRKRRQGASWISLPAVARDGACDSTESRCNDAGSRQGRDVSGHQAQSPTDVLVRFIIGDQLDASARPHFPMASRALADTIAVTVAGADAPATQIVRAASSAAGTETRRT